MIRITIDGDIHVQIKLRVLSEHSNLKSIQFIKHIISSVFLKL